jgi:hypothetical protein
MIKWEDIKPGMYWLWCYPEETTSCLYKVISKDEDDIWKLSIFDVGTYGDGAAPDDEEEITEYDLNHGDYKEDILFPEEDLDKALKIIKLKFIK